ncbi:MAG: hypothetical protein IJT95_05700 [Abditibacteriota bacterium]|nr:hypothetical protein [Abditibacteriota bacterium]
MERYRASHGYVRNPGPAMELPEPLLSVPACNVRKAETPITIDGELDDWQGYTGLAIDRDNHGGPAPVETKVMTAWDDEGIMFAFECAEPNMAGIKADAAERDGPTFNDDSVEVFLNMNPAQVKYNHFSVNVNNVRFDQQIYNSSWNKEWQSAVKKTDRGWQCEMKIPFSEMSVPVPVRGERWRINMTRNRNAGGSLENLCWSVTYGSFHVLERFGNAYFVKTEQ